MYAERVWCPLASWGGRVVVAALFMGDAFFDGVPGCSSPATTMRREPAVNHDAPGLSRTRLAGLLRFRPEDPRRELGGGYVRRLPLSLWLGRSSPGFRFVIHLVAPVCSLTDFRVYERSGGTCARATRLHRRQARAG